MKKLIVLFMSLFIGFSSCKKEDGPKKPDNLISQDKMVDILIDLSLISSAKGVNKKLIENNGITPDKYVYQKHAIDSLQFSESNTYYAYFIDDYSDIYSRVKDSLNRLKIKYEKLEQTESKKEEISKIRKNPKFKRDSLMKPRQDSLLKPPVFKDN